VAHAPDNTARTIQAATLAWILPGAGHYYLGHRGLALVFCLAISLPYFAGLAIGGVLNSVNPRTNPWLFLAELGIGGYTTPGAFVSRGIEGSIARRENAGVRVARTDYVSYYPESDVAQIYLATAGLLNLLAILDAISRAQTGGLPTFQRELEAAQATESGP